MSRNLSLRLATGLGLLVALVSYRFLAQGPGAAIPTMGAHIDGARLAFLAHVSAAPLALALGAFQFFPGLRARRPGLHRWSGRLYALAILVAGIGALAMGPTITGGLPAQLGFGPLALAWLATTGNALRLAMAGRIAAHRRWMIRSYALTFAAVTLRIELALLVGGFGLSYAAAIVILAWACWLPNLALAELALRRKAG